MDDQLRQIFTFMGRINGSVIQLRDVSMAVCRALALFLLLLDLLSNLIVDYI